MFFRYSAVAAFVLAACSAWAQVATLIETPKSGAATERTYKLEKTSADSYRLFIPRSDISPSAKCVEISTDFARAKRGDAGSIIFSRGEIVDFDAPDGRVNLGRFILPIVAMKTDKCNF